MILFKNLKWKNFLSTGNNWTEMDFLANKTTLVVGHNGAGKSTMLDALSFALFGKPHRNINKPQLINSINNKDCSVEVIFTVAGSEYKIIRGLKPTVFEIYKNNILLNQESHNKEYQKILEQNILKLNHKSFHQIVVLGSSSFIPFMQLPSQHRREVIEDLLDINIFSKMNTILKEKNSILKDSIRDVEYRLEVMKNKIDTQKKYIGDINRINKDLKEQKEAAINALEQEQQQLMYVNDDLLLKIQHQGAIWPTQLDKSQKKLNQLQQYQTQFNTDIKTVVKEAKFFEENCTCPTCSQDISIEVKEEKTKTASSKAKELMTAVEKVKSEIELTTQEVKTAKEHLDQVSANQLEFNTNSSTINRIEKQMNIIRNEIDNLTDTTSDISVAKTDLEEFIEQKDSMMEEKFKYNEQYQYNVAIAEMLKDTGIKTKIVKQYLPVINKLVNQYLQILDFFVHFNLDESFTESIRSRHRDSFSYASFSEGEKQRIDLALLFTWRQVAKMKNSVATNLLVLDETFDSSLDYEGVDNLMKIIYSLDESTNVFVISHKGDILDGKFESKIEFIKEKNFSKIK
jgi:DNA repair exonuclease SbcCD ATPase subunit